MKAIPFLGLIGVSFGFLGGVLGSTLSLWVLSQKPPYTYGSVDTTKLIQHQVSLILKEKNSDQEEALIQQTQVKLKEILKTWAKQKYLIVLDKKAVLTPLPDMTASLLKDLQRQRFRSQS